jgi:hypothetical protein
MKFLPHQLLAIITALAVFSYTMLPQPAMAAEHHVVSLSELQQEMSASAQARAKNLEDISRVLALPAAQEALSKVPLSAKRIETAIAALDDHELLRLADRARAAEQDVQGGFIVGILALIGLVVVILIVVAVVSGDD